MSRRADFIDAHRRHLEDANLLFDKARWANADHLYGLSAECGLKAIMLSLGMSVDAGGTPIESEHRRHVNGLWPVFEDFAQGSGGEAYLASLPSGDPFSGWSIHDRYANRSFFQRANVASHRCAARQVGHSVQRAALEGAP